MAGYNCVVARARKQLSAPPKGAAKGKAKAQAKDGEPEKLPRRARLFRRIMQVGVMRRFTARRLMKTIEKSHKKGRVLPDQLEELDEYLKKVPAKQRRQVLEATLSGELEASAGRAMRRAAQRQGRQSGKAGGGARPGMPPIPKAARKVR